MEKESLQWKNVSEFLHAEQIQNQSIQLVQLNKESNQLLILPCLGEGNYVTCVVYSIFKKYKLEKEKNECT